MKITLNSEEKALMKKWGKIKLSLLCLPEDYFGHYWIQTKADNISYIKAKKRGLQI